MMWLAFRQSIYVIAFVLVPMCIPLPPSLPARRGTEDAGAVCVSTIRTYGSLTLASSRVCFLHHYAAPSSHLFGPRPQFTLPPILYLIPLKPRCRSFTTTTTPDLVPLHPSPPLPRPSIEVPLLPPPSYPRPARRCRLAPTPPSRWI